MCGLISGKINNTFLHFLTDGQTFASRSFRRDIAISNMRTYGQKGYYYFYFLIQIFIATILIFGVSSNTCTSKLKCGECIAAGPDCAWCWKKDKPDQNFTMCDTKENLKKNCKEIDIVSPSSTIQIEKDSPLSNKGAEKGEAVQIKPQQMRIKLRPNTVISFSVEFRQAVDYPVDLYYLMDLSNSMKDDKDNLEKLGGVLAAKMGSITKDFKLGFGSFVDKTVAPFVSTHKNKLVSPCEGCSAPYGFKNNMKLSLKTDEFAKKVKDAQISGNLDAPEGGFDAIMQAVVCKKEIGWRNDSRKLLVYSSDNSFHYAGDGKLAGLVEPNDEKCHLDKDGFYTKSTVQDYPSLSQINRQIQQHSVNIIFAVTAEQAKLYKQLSKLLKGSTTGTLDRDSKNVVGLVQEQYEEITSSVEMTDNVRDNYIKLTYKSKCLGTELEKTNVCGGLKVENNVVFEVDLEFSFCPPDREEWKKTFKIFPVGLQDSLTVELEMLCECDCEKTQNEEVDSPKCSAGNGTFVCGICRCNEKRDGKLCECDTSQTTEAKDDQCYNGNNTRPCSGVGKCRCGKCTCNKGYDGRYCECNSLGCDKKEGKMCSGPDHGRCDCGKCKCYDGWKGDDCSCRDSNEPCMNNGEVCSGRGVCRCGSCFCENTQGEEFFGPFCDDCATCPGKCSELKECVECRFKNQQGGSSNCSSCDGVTIDFADKFDVGEKEKLCAFEDDEKCRYAFKYSIDENNKLSALIKSKKECPVPLPVVAIVSGVSGGVVATGLFLLMLWKILTTIHDRRELAKFEKERLNAKWNQDDNPIYVEATSTYQNPAYRGE